jgi:hypothetical protein
LRFLINSGDFVIVGEYDKEIINLAQQIIGQQQPKSAPPPAEPKSQPPTPSGLAVEARAEARQDTAAPAAVPTGRETKTAEELAGMIEADLAKHPQCPRKGLVVTVYGTTLWRAMLMITPAAGPVRDPQEWRDLTEQLAERLRQRYDLAWR